jgi:hypothetical protein
VLQHNVDQSDQIVWQTATARTAANGVP